ncbi:MAG: AcrR family transcriptional regulator [Myxococcota bacterium]|jgi:AcrR family transcriptional regulator
MARRTQKQRREATISRLIAATVEALAGVGHSRASISEICRRAEVSHGGLFRHFPSRVALMSAAGVAIGKGLVADAAAAFARTVGEGGLRPEDRARVAVVAAMELSGGPAASAWRELLVAARTDADLCAGLVPTEAAFRDGVRQLMQATLGADVDAEPVARQAFRVMAVLDSMAIHEPVLAMHEGEAELQLEWLVGLAQSALDLVDNR